MTLVGQSCCLRYALEKLALRTMRELSKRLAQKATSSQGDRGELLYIKKIREITLKRSHFNAPFGSTILSLGRELECFSMEIRSQKRGQSAIRTYFLRSSYQHVMDHPPKVTMSQLGNSRNEDDAMNLQPYFL